MANRYFNDLQALNKQVKVIAGSFAADSNGDPTTLKGKGFSMSRPSVGVYQVDLQNSYVDLISGQVDFEFSTPVAAFVQLGAVDVTSSKSVQIKVYSTGNTDAAETTEVTTVAETSAKEVAEVTFPAVAAATQADYVSFSTQSGTTYAFWLDIDAAGTAPTGAVYTAATNKIKVGVATGDTAADVAAKAYAVINALSIPNVTVSYNNAAKVTLSQTKFGATTNAAPHDENDAGAGSITVSTTTGGAASPLNSKYFTMFSANNITGYYVWFNVNGQGVDPAVAGKTGIQVAIAVGRTDVQVADAISAAVDPLADFTATNVGAVVTITNVANGSTTNTADGAAATGFGFATTVQGDSKLQNMPNNASDRIQFQLYLKNTNITG